MTAMDDKQVLPSLIGGRYLLESKIAHGGMAVVWLATDTFLSRKVAVKLLRPHLVNDPTLAERFRREAIASASISHPNIVAVYDCIEHNGQQAVIMQLIKGKSLRELLDKQKRLGPKLTIHIGISVAAALDEAHENNFIHRDVKPGNIMITPEGQVLLTDFGIAKAMTSGEEDLTHDNIMMGTAKYLAPEQVRGKPLDGRSDLYSLGLVLYECLAGRVPFLGESDADTALARLQREPTDLARLRPSLSPQLVRVIHKLLARNPEHRYATGHETKIALRAALTGVHDTTTELTPPSGLQHVHETTESADSQYEHVRRPRQQRGSYALRRMFVGLSALSMLAGILLWQVSGDTTTQEASIIEPIPVEPVAIASLSTFDPLGDDGVENDELLPNLLDGDPATVWSTSCYDNQYFGSKEFVGLILQLTRPATGTLRIGMHNAPWAIDVYAANDAPPTNIEGWGTSISRGYNTKRERASFAVDNPTQYLLIKIREAGKGSQCTTAFPYSASLAGIAFIEG
jgi:serine/threonine protein kinase